MIVKTNIPRLLGSSDDKEKIGAARPEGPPLRGFQRTRIEETVKKFNTPVETHAGVIVQKLQTEDTLTGLTNVEENAYIGALPNEDQ